MWMNSGKATKKRTFGGTRNANHPMSNRQLAPNLEKHVPVIPSTPIPSPPALKRTRSAITPPQLRLDDESVIRELKARKNNEADLLDYVKGLLCETPIAKQSIINISALAGILLKSGNVYFFFRTIFRTI